MFAQQIGRGSRQIGRVAQRLTRGGQLRSYAAQSQTQGNGSRQLASKVLIGLAGATVGVVGTWRTMQQSGMGFFSDEESLKRFVPSDDEARLVDETINNHPLVAQLRADSKYKESRPHMKMPASYRSKSLTAGALTGSGKMVTPPYAWIEDGGKSIVCVTYVGEDVCGHPGIVHGGFLATMLDEGLARGCFAALPHNIAVTANLNINYRKPTPANSYLVLRATTTKVEGRKAWVTGHIESLAKPGEEPTIFAEANALFISPKYASMMPKIV